MATAAGAVLVAASYSVRAAPQNSQTADPLPALLAEVRALRIAMENNVTIAPRVQLTLARLGVEEQRMTQLAMQLDRVQQELTTHNLAFRQMADELTDVEKRLEATSDDKTRRELEVGIADLKTRLKGQAAAEEAARTRLNEVAQALSTEQARWIDLNSRLDELDRLLGPIPR
jgi:chromosome segregation ATPase